MFRKSKFGFGLKIIAFLLIQVFICSDLSWAANGELKSTLSPPLRIEKISDEFNQRYQTKLPQSSTGIGASPENLANVTRGKNRFTPASRLLEETGSAGVSNEIRVLPILAIAAVIMIVGGGFATIVAFALLIVPSLAGGLILQQAGSYVWRKFLAIPWYKWLLTLPGRYITLERLTTLAYNDILDRNEAIKLLLGSFADEDKWVRGKARLLIRHLEPSDSALIDANVDILVSDNKAAHQDAFNHLLKLNLMPDTAERLSAFARNLPDDKYVDLAGAIAKLKERDFSEQEILAFLANAYKNPRDEISKPAEAKLIRYISDSINGKVTEAQGRISGFEGLLITADHIKKAVDYILEYGSFKIKYYVPGQTEMLTLPYLEITKPRWTARKSKTYEDTAANEDLSSPNAIIRAFVKTNEFVIRHPIISALIVIGIGIVIYAIFFSPEPAAKSAGVIDPSFKQMDFNWFGICDYRSIQDRLRQQIEAERRRQEEEAEAERRRLEEERRKAEEEAERLRLEEERLKQEAEERQRQEETDRENRDKDAVSETENTRQEAIERQRKIEDRRKEVDALIAQLKQAEKDAVIQARQKAASDKVAVEKAIEQRAKDFQQALERFTTRLNQAIRVAARKEETAITLSDSTRHDIRFRLVRLLAQLTDNGTLNRENLIGEGVDDWIANGYFDVKERTTLIRILSSAEMQTSLDAVMQKAKQEFVPLPAAKKKSTRERLFSNDDHGHTHIHKPRGKSTTKTMNQRGAISIGLLLVALPVFLLLAYIGYTEYPHLLAWFNQAFDGINAGHSLVKSPHFLNNDWLGFIGVNAQTAMPAPTLPLSANNNDTSIEETKPDPIARFTISLTERAKNELINDSAYIDKIEELNNCLTKGKGNAVLVGDHDVTNGFIEAVAYQVSRNQIKEAMPANLRDREFLYLNVPSLLYAMAEVGRFEDTIRELREAINLAAEKEGKRYVFVFDFRYIHWIKREREKLFSSVKFLFGTLLDSKDVPVVGLCNEQLYKEFFEKKSKLKEKFEEIHFADLPKYEVAAHIRDYLARIHEVYPQLPADMRNELMQEETIEKVLGLVERHMEFGNNPNKLEEMLDKIITAKINRPLTLQARLNNLKKKMLSAVAKYEAALAKKDEAEIKYLKDILQQYAEEARGLKEKAGNLPKEKLDITVEEIVELISTETRIPVKDILREMDDKLENYQENIRNRLIGQEKAVDATYEAFDSRNEGMSEAGKPIGAFIFAGPTGVGKTELAKAIAEHYFGSEDKLSRFDMSEYMLPHEVKRLIGAPPGAVGFEEGGQLINAVRRKPYSVLLFDEFEKAHPEIYEIFLDILDTGKITDNHGKTVSFENTIIIFTSNLGMAETQDMYKALEWLERLSDEELSSLMEKPGADARKVSEDEKNLRFVLKQIGFKGKTVKQAKTAVEKAIHDTVMTAFRENTRQEILGRFDEHGGIVMFHKLSREDISDIFDVKVKQKNEFLRSRGLELKITPSLKEKIIEEGYDAAFGARPLERALSRMVLSPLARDILNDRFERGDLITADYKDGRVSFTVAKPDKKEEALDLGSLEGLDKKLLAGGKNIEKIFGIPEIKVSVVSSVTPAPTENELLINEFVDEDELRIMFREEFGRQRGKPVEMLEPPEKEYIEGLVKKKKEEEIKRINQYFDNLSLAALPEETKSSVLRGEDISQVLAVLQQKMRNYPFLVNGSSFGLDHFVQEFSRQCFEGSIPGYERSRFLKLNLEMFADQMGLIGKPEDQMRKFLDAIEKDDQAKGLRTIIVIDYDELAEEMQNLRKGEERNKSEEFNLGFFMFAFLNRKNIRLIMTSTEKEPENLEAFPKFFSKVEIENLAKEEARERFYLFEKERLEARLKIREGVNYTHETLENIVDLFAKSLPNESSLELLVKFFEDIYFYKEKTREILATSFAREKYELSRILQQAINKRKVPATLEELLANEQLVERVRRIMLLEKRLAEENPEQKVITVDDAYEFLAKNYGCEKSKLTIDEKKNLLELEERLKQRIIGQDEAVDALADLVRIGKAGLKPLHKPIGTLWFAGPTGVGKTELPKVLAAELGMNVIEYGFGKIKTVFDASEILGAPPGYVGYGKTVTLPDQVEKNPRSVIIFNEVDKIFDTVMREDGKKSILDIVLQMLEDGRITDSNGKTADLSQCIIVFTANGGLKEVFDERGLRGNDDHSIYDEIKEAVLGDDAGKFDGLKRKIEERVHKYNRHILRPEILNRFDKVVVFNPLLKQALSEIVKLELRKLSQRLDDQYQLEFGEDAAQLDELVNYLMEKGFSPDNGVRGIKSLLNKKLLKQFKEFIKAEKKKGINKNDRIIVRLNKGKTGFEFKLKKGDKISLANQLKLSAAETVVFNNIMAGIKESAASGVSRLEIKDIEPWLSYEALAPRDKGRELSFTQESQSVSLRNNNFAEFDKGLDAFIQGLEEVMPTELGDEDRELVIDWIMETVTLAKRENIKQTAYEAGGKIENFYELESSELNTLMAKALKAANKDKYVKLDWELMDGQLQIAVKFNSAFSRELYARLFTDNYKDTADVEQKAGRLLEGWLKANLRLKGLNAETGFYALGSGTTLWVRIPVVKPVEVIEEVEELEEAALPPADIAVNPDAPTIDGNGQQPAASAETTVNIDSPALIDPVPFIVREEDAGGNGQRQGMDATPSAIELPAEEKEVMPVVDKKPPAISPVAFKPLELKEITAPSSVEAIDEGGELSAAEQAAAIKPGEMEYHRVLTQGDALPQIGFDEINDFHSFVAAEDGLVVWLRDKRDILHLVNIIQKDNAWPEFKKIADNNNRDMPYEQIFPPVALEDELLFWGISKKAAQNKDLDGLTMERFDLSSGQREKILLPKGVIFDVAPLDVKRIVTIKISRPYIDVLITTQDDKSRLARINRNDINEIGPVRAKTILAQDQLIKIAGVTGKITYMNATSDGNIIVKLSRSNGWHYLLLSENQDGIWEGEKIFSNNQKINNTPIKQIEVITGYGERMLVIATSGEKKGVKHLLEFAKTNGGQWQMKKRFSLNDKVRLSDKTGRIKKMGTIEDMSEPSLLGDRAALRLKTNNKWHIFNLEFGPSAAIAGREEPARITALVKEAKNLEEILLAFRLDLSEVSGGDLAGFKEKLSQLRKDIAELNIAGGSEGENVFAENIAALKEAVERLEEQGKLLIKLLNNKNIPRVAEGLEELAGLENIGALLFNRRKRLLKDNERAEHQGMEYQRVMSLSDIKWGLAEPEISLLGYMNAETARSLAWARLGDKSPETKLVDIRHQYEGLKLSTDALENFYNTRTVVDVGALDRDGEDILSWVKLTDTSSRKWNMIRLSKAETGWDWKQVFAEEDIFPNFKDRIKNIEGFNYSPQRTEVLITTTDDKKYLVEIILNEEGDLSAVETLFEQGEEYEVAGIVGRPNNIYMAGPGNIILQLEDDHKNLYLVRVKFDRNGALVSEEEIFSTKKPPSGAGKIKKVAEVAGQGDRIMVLSETPEKHLVEFTRQDSGKWVARKIYSVGRAAALFGDIVPGIGLTGKIREIKRPYCEGDKLLVEVKDETGNWHVVDVSLSEANGRMEDIEQRIAALEKQRMVLISELLEAIEGEDGEELSNISTEDTSQGAARFPLLSDEQFVQRREVKPLLEKIEQIRAMGKEKIITGFETVLKKDEASSMFGQPARMGAPSIFNGQVAVKLEPLSGEAKDKDWLMLSMKRVGQGKWTSAKELSPSDTVLVDDGGSVVFDNLSNPVLTLAGMAFKAHTVENQVYVSEDLVCISKSEAGGKTARPWLKGIEADRDVSVYEDTFAFVELTYEDISRTQREPRVRLVFAEPKSNTETPQPAKGFFSRWAKKEEPAAYNYRGLFSVGDKVDGFFNQVKKINRPSLFKNQMVTRVEAANSAMGLVVSVQNNDGEWISKRLTTADFEKLGLGSWSQVDNFSDPIITEEGIFTGIRIHNYWHMIRLTSQGDEWQAQLLFSQGDDFEGIGQIEYFGVPAVSEGRMTVGVERSGQWQLINIALDKLVNNTASPIQSKYAEEIIALEERIALIRQEADKRVEAVNEINGKIEELNELITDKMENTLAAKDDYTALEQIKVNESSGKVTDSGVFFTNSGHIFVAEPVTAGNEGDGFVLTVLDGTGEIDGSFGDAGKITLKDAYGVKAVDVDNEGNVILVYNRYSGSENRAYNNLGIYAQKNNEFSVIVQDLTQSNYANLVVDNYTDYIYMTFGNDKVQVYNKKGEKKNIGDGYKGLSNASGMSADEQGNLFVIDSKEQAVFIFGRDGKLNYTLGKNGVIGSGILAGPIQVSQGLNDTLLVTDVVKGEVFIFNKIDGNLIRSFGQAEETANNLSKTEKGKGLRLLSFMEQDGKIRVYDSKKKRVSIFASISGLKANKKQLEAELDLRKQELDAPILMPGDELPQMEIVEQAI